MTAAAPTVVRPWALWLGAALALPAGLRATWTISTAAVAIALVLLGALGGAWVAARGTAAVTRQLTVGLVALAVLVAGVWTSGVTGSLLPATAGSVSPDSGDHFGTASDSTADVRRTRTPSSARPFR